MNFASSFSIQFISYVVIILSVSGCQFIMSTQEIPRVTDNFVQAIIEEDYHKAIGSFALDSEYGGRMNYDTIMNHLPNLRLQLTENFGRDLSLKLMSAQKNFSTIATENTLAGATDAMVQFENETHFGLLKVLFHDESKGILNFEILNTKREIPSLTQFWLFGIICLLVLTFNIYVIYKIVKSDLSKKWFKVLSVVFLNFPAIYFYQVGGLVLKFNLQMMFGIGFMNMGYLNSYLAAGIPLGGIYWFYKLVINKPSKLEDLEIKDIEDNLVEGIDID